LSGGFREDQNNFTTETRPHRYGSVAGAAQRSQSSDCLLLKILELDPYPIQTSVTMVKRFDRMLFVLVYALTLGPAQRNYLV
jgi:hypothetical protein